MSVIVALTWLPGKILEKLLPLAELHTPMISSRTSNAPTMIKARRLPPWLLPPRVGRSGGRRVWLAIGRGLTLGALEGLGLALGVGRPGAAGVAAPLASALPTMAAPAPAAAMAAIFPVPPRWVEPDGGVFGALGLAPLANGVAGWGKGNVLLGNWPEIAGPAVLAGRVGSAGVRGVVWPGMAANCDVACGRGELAGFLFFGNWPEIAGMAVVACGGVWSGRAMNGVVACGKGELAGVLCNGWLAGLFLDSGPEAAGIAVVVCGRGELLGLFFSGWLTGALGWPWPVGREPLGVGLAVGCVLARALLVPPGKTITSCDAPPSLFVRPFLGGVGGVVGSSLISCGVAEGA